MANTTIKNLPSITDQEGSISSSYDLLAIWDDDANTTKKVSVEALGSVINENIVQVETDPIYSASPASGITNEDITRWNNGSQSLQGLVDGSATGSVRGIGTVPEGSGYELGEYAFAEGYSTTAAFDYAHAEGSGTVASGISAHAEGGNSIASGSGAHAEGYETTASGAYSHAEGCDTVASGSSTHAGGHGTVAQRAEQTVIGVYNRLDIAGPTSTKGNYVFIIGNGTGAADNNRSNALTVDWEGNVVAAGSITAEDLLVSGNSVSTASNLVNGSSTNSVRGTGTTQEDNSYTIGNYAFAEGGNTSASGYYSHAGGYGTIANSKSLTTIGEYNILDFSNRQTTRGAYAFIIGNGTDNDHRSNALDVTWDGDLTIAGSYWNSNGKIGEILIEENDSIPQGMSLLAGAFYCYQTIELSLGTWAIQYGAWFDNKTNGSTYIDFSTGDFPYAEAYLTSNANQDYTAITTYNSRPYNYAILSSTTSCIVPGGSSASSLYRNMQGTYINGLYICEVTNENNGKFALIGSHTVNSNYNTPSIVLTKGRIRAVRIA